jgi:YVTN family beta-propeller protein
MGRVSKRWLLIILAILLLNYIIVIIGWLVERHIKKTDTFTKTQNSSNIYAYTRAGMLSDTVHNALFRVYVPNSSDNTVSVIDPRSYQVLYKFKTGKNPQHVVPSFDLKTLWVVNNASHTLTPIDPTTGKPGINLGVDDPYNLYFTPEGHFAIVVCEMRKRLDFRDPHTMVMRGLIPVQCKGINHMDFTADNRYAIATCEFSGQLVKIDLSKRKVIGYLTLKRATTSKRGGTSNHSMPQDIRLSPDGRTFYVADMVNDGVFLIDPVTFTQIGFIATGIGAHGIYPSRDGKFLYVANRGCNHIYGHRHGPGSVAVIDPKLRKVIATWAIPGGGSPDMGNVTADGKELWLSGRYDNEVYVFDTRAGKLTHRIAVGRGPHGLAVWPQPGRYSLGHTGNMR